MLGGAGLVAALGVLGLGGCGGPSAPTARLGGPQAFDTYRTVDRGRVVVVAFAGGPREPGPCGVDYRAVASETGDRVYIRVDALPHRVLEGVVACPPLSQRRTATVTLQAPLGARAVVDGTTGGMLVPPPR